MARNLRSTLRRPVPLLLVALPLLAVACSDSGSPTDPVCVVQSVTVNGLPALLTAGVPVQLTAQIEGTNCAGAEVTWSGPVQLDVSDAGAVTGTHLGGPFTVTATVAGVAGTAETAVAPAPLVADARWSLAWMENPTTASYTVDETGYSYASSSGGPIESTRSGPGRYTVTFNGLAAGVGQRTGIHLSAYYTGGPRRCRVLSSTNVGANLVVEVRCDNLAGAPTDSRFDIVVVPAGSMTGRSGFAVSTDPEGGVVPAELAHNSESEPIRVSRTSQGQYTVVFDGMSRNAVPGSGPEIFHVTAYGEGTAWCKLSSWTSNAALSANVRCFTPTGTPVDAPFSILTLERARTGGHRLGFIWAHDPTSAALYTPSLGYSFNSAGGLNQARQDGVGVYIALWGGLARTLDPNAETNLVTAYGSDATYCQVDGWSGASTDFLCYAPDGSPANSAFNAIWIE